MLNIEKDQRKVFIVRPNLQTSLKHLKVLLLQQLTQEESGLIVMIIMFTSMMEVRGLTLKMLLQSLHKLLMLRVIFLLQQIKLQLHQQQEIQFLLVLLGLHQL